MKNRVSRYPGRVRLTPVAGQPNVYDMTRADDPTEEGTPINKATLLTDQTAALYPGLDGDSAPDDAFAALGVYTQWRWLRRKYKYEVHFSNYLRSRNLATRDTTRTVAIYYSDQISINQGTGKIELLNQKYVSLSYDSSVSQDLLLNKYFKIGESVYKAYETSTISGFSVGGGDEGKVIYDTAEVSSVYVTGKWELSDQAEWESTNGSSDFNHTLYWSESVNISPGGNVELISPQERSITRTSADANFYNTLLGKYFRVNNSEVYFAGDTFYAARGTNPTRIYFQNALIPTAKQSEGPWEEVRASTNNAYPDSGVSGGYEYEAQGMPLEKAAALSPGGGNSGGGSGESWKVGAGLKLSSNILSVDTANAVTAGDARPVTSGAVKTALEGSKWTAGSGLKLTGSTLSVDTAASVETGGNKPVTAAAVKTALDGLTPGPDRSGPVLVPATIKFTLADSGSTAYPQGSTQLWLLYDGGYLYLPGDATFVFASAVKLDSFSVTIAPSTGYQWTPIASSGTNLSVIQTTYSSGYAIDRPVSINVSSAVTGSARIYTLLSTQPYTDAVTLCAGVLGAGGAI